MTSEISLTSDLRRRTRLQARRAWVLPIALAVLTAATVGVHLAAGWGVTGLLWTVGFPLALAGVLLDLRRAERRFGIAQHPRPTLGIAIAIYAAIWASAELAGRLGWDLATRNAGVIVLTIAYVGFAIALRVPAYTGIAAVIAVAGVAAELTEVRLLAWLGITLALGLNAALLRRQVTEG